jgi:hypothetical protein
MSSAASASLEVHNDTKIAADTDGCRAGTQEQPKVIYIVPWQPPQAPAATSQPIGNLVMQDLLQPIDRDTFRRQVQYRTVLTERATAKPAPAAQ